MPVKSVAKEADDILLAGEMIRLGARLQVLQAETDISHDRLARLYREIRGCSPPKGMLPFSVDWFMTWLPNIHSSLFYNVYQFFHAQSPARGIRAIIDAYKLYLEHVRQGGAPAGPEADASPVALGAMGHAEVDAPLSFTRAWMLVRFFDSGMLQLSACQSCSGHFVTHAHDPKQGFVCAICRPPPRAGKTRAAARRQAATAVPTPADCGTGANPVTVTPAAAKDAAPATAYATATAIATANETVAADATVAANPTATAPMPRKKTAAAAAAARVAACRTTAVALNR